MKTSAAELYATYRNTWPLCGRQTRPYPFFGVDSYPGILSRVLTYGNGILMMLFGIQGYSDLGLFR